MKTNKGYIKSYKQANLDVPSHSVGAMFTRNTVGLTFFANNKQFNVEMSPMEASVLANSLREAAIKIMTTDITTHSPEATHS